MAKKICITLIEGGVNVGYYADVEIVQYPSGGKTLIFKVNENSLSVKGKEHDKVITKTYTTTIPALIEETIEHSGLFSV